MIIRQSTPEDLPQIITLLKTSIGETLTPKTEGYFVWKHEKNPFGRSKVLLAIEGGKIIGLRAFMRWSWESKNENIRIVLAEVKGPVRDKFHKSGLTEKLGENHFFVTVNDAFKAIQGQGNDAAPGIALQTNALGGQ